MIRLILAVLVPVVAGLGRVTASVLVGGIAAVSLVVLVAVAVIGAGQPLDRSARYRRDTGDARVYTDVTIPAVNR